MRTVSHDADPAAWLESRDPAAPPELLAKLQEAVAALRADAGDSLSGAHSHGMGQGTDEALPALVTTLAEAALDRFRAALALGDDRSAAFELLAADALLTYAFEAAAEVGPDAVSACARVYGPARLAALLDS